jgi:small neutral amino acid transporter SnatA (MarC family)
MTDLGYAFTIYFMTLGPVKTIPAFFLATQGADRRTVVTLAMKSAIVATTVALFIALFASGVLVTWRISVDAVAIAGGIVLFMASAKTLAGFTIIEPLDEPGAIGAARPPAPLRWTGRPVLSPLAIPAIVSPSGVVAILDFCGTAIGDTALQTQLVLMLLTIMVSNFAAMAAAGPIMRAIGLPVLQVVSWVFSALQAGLAVQIVISAIRNLW